MDNKSQIEIGQNSRGFELLYTPPYGRSDKRTRDIICRASSIIRDDLGLQFPGSSCLWVGEAHLERADVEQLIKHLQHWLTYGTLNFANEEPAASFERTVMLLNEQAAALRASKETGETSAET
jgi:hypothetical protein